MNGLLEGEGVLFLALILWPNWDLVLLIRLLHSENMWKLTGILRELVREKKVVPVIFSYPKNDQCIFCTGRKEQPSGDGRYHQPCPFPYFWRVYPPRYDHASWLFCKTSQSSIAQAASLTFPLQMSRSPVVLLLTKPSFHIGFAFTLVCVSQSLQPAG